MKPQLTLADYQRTAERLGCEIAAIMAVSFVESSGSGFDANGTLKKRFEPVWFKRLSGKIATTYAAAYALDPTNAMKATSWGKFQVMGFNHRIAGFATVKAMVDAFDKSETAQLDGFIGFIESKRLQDELQTLNWSGFAYIYNGSDYAKLGYHTKMAKAYAQYKADPAISVADAELKKKAQQRPQPLLPPE